MSDQGEDQRESGTIQHLEAALAKEDASEKNYHIRQALQHLDVE